MEGKKDVLEFPLEELEVPHAITIMMQAATQCVEAQTRIVDGAPYGYTLETDLDRLQLLCEKLDARIDDELDKARAVRDIPAEEDEPNKFVDADPSDTILVYEDDMVHQVVHDGVIFQKACNHLVYSAEGIETTYCIKQWDHANMHEDMFGNEG